MEQSPSLDVSYYLTKWSQQNWTLYVSDGKMGLCLKARLLKYSHISEIKITLKEFQSLSLLLACLTPRLWRWGQSTPQEAANSTASHGDTPPEEITLHSDREKASNLTRWNLVHHNFHSDRSGSERTLNAGTIIGPDRRSWSSSDLLIKSWIFKLAMEASSTSWPTGIHSSQRLSPEVTSLHRYIPRCW
jgi:hypothetical protein